MKSFGVALLMLAVAAGAASAARNDIRLAVTPGEAQAGTPTTFRFHATRDGRPLAGRTVRFAGRRAKTGRRGRAAIRTTLPKGGSYVARVGRATATVVAGDPPPPAQPARRPESFTGECAVKGRVNFDPPMTNTPQRITQTVDGPLGTCTGSFVDAEGREHDVKDLEVSEKTVAVGENMSCATATPVGPGTLYFPQGEIDFTFEEYRVGAAPYVRLVGANGGEGNGLVTPTGPGAPPELVAKCGAEGIDHVIVEGTLRVEGLAG